MTARFASAITLFVSAASAGTISATTLLSEVDSGMLFTQRMLVSGGGIGELGSSLGVEGSLERRTVRNVENVFNVQLTAGEIVTLDFLNAFDPGEEVFFSSLSFGGFAPPTRLAWLDEGSAVAIDQSPFFAADQSLVSAVRAIADETGSVQLAVTGIEDEELTGSHSQSGFLGLSVSSAPVLVSGDVDFFQFADLSAGEQIRIDISGGEGLQFAMFDDEGQPISAVDASFETTVDESGGFIIGVTGAGDTGYLGRHDLAGDLSQYTISVTIIPAPSAALVPVAGLALARRRRG